MSTCADARHAVFADTGRVRSFASFGGAVSVLSRSVPVRVLWALIALAGLYVLGAGLGRSFYIEPTQEALASARVGVGMVYAASLVLVGAAAVAVRLGGPRWVGVAVALPALLCGGLTVVAGETLLPLLSAALAYPVAVGGVVVGLFRRCASV
jgi:hypothetical protein